MRTVLANKSGTRTGYHADELTVVLGPTAPSQNPK